MERPMNENFNIISPRSMYKEHLLFATKIIIKRSPIHRWGIFAREKIHKHEIIEESPYIFVPSDEISTCYSCLPYSYDLYEDSIIGMGNCGLYNHSFDANVDYEIDKVNEIMRHYAIKDINAGEELTLDYGEENAKNFPEKTEINKEQ